MQKIKCFFIFITLVALVETGCYEKKQAQTETLLTPSQFEDFMLKATDGVLIDVCTPSEFELKKIKNAINIDYNSDDFEIHISQLDKEKTYFVYCLAGTRSKIAAEDMRKMGFTKVFELQGGLSNWIRENKPIESNQKRPLTGLSTKEFYNAPKKNNA